MKKSLRIALAIAVLAALVPIAMAAPTGGVPQPKVVDSTSWSLILAAILSWLGL